MREEVQAEAEGMRGAIRGRLQEQGKGLSGGRKEKKRAVVVAAAAQVAAVVSFYSLLFLAVQNPVFLTFYRCKILRVFILLFAISFCCYLSV